MEKAIGRSILVVFVVFALAGVANATLIPIFNTGVNSSGVPVANGTVGDLHYILTVVPSGTSVIRISTSAGGYPIDAVGLWIGDDSISAWIGPNNGSTSDPAGTYTYRTTFDLTGLDPATAILTGQWAADGSGTGLLLNGVSTGNTAGGWTVFSPFTISSGFIAGVNTLDFVVPNVDGYTGLRVELSGTANSDVPEPASFVLLGAGLAALAAFRQRLV